MLCKIAIKNIIGQSAIEDGRPVWVSEATPVSAAYGMHLLRFCARSPLDHLYHSGRPRELSTSKSVSFKKGPRLVRTHIILNTRAMARPRVDLLTMLKATHQS